MLPIVGDDRVRNSKLTDNVLPNKVCAFGFSDCGQWLGLYPLGEVINYNDGELSLSLNDWEWPDQVYSPLRE